MTEIDRAAEYGRSTNDTDTYGATPELASLDIFENGSNSAKNISNDIWDKANLTDFRNNLSFESHSTSRELKVAKLELANNATEKGQERTISEYKPGDAYKSPAEIPYKKDGVDLSPDKIERTSEGIRLGRLGMKSNQLEDWLKSLDPRIFEEREQKGLVPPGTVKRMQMLNESVSTFRKDADASKLHPFLKAVRAGEITDQLKEMVKENLPPEVEREATSWLIGRAAMDIFIQEGKTDLKRAALSVRLDKLPTETDVNLESNRKFMNAVQDLSEQMSKRRGASYDWHDVGKRLDNASRSMVGTQQWLNFKEETGNGNLACAIFTTNPLFDMGLMQSRDLEVKGAVGKAMFEEGWQAMSAAEIFSGNYSQEKLANIGTGLVVRPHGLTVNGEFYRTGHIGFALLKSGEFVHNRSATGLGVIEPINNNNGFPFHADLNPRTGKPEPNMPGSIILFPPGTLRSLSESKR